MRVVQVTPRYAPYTGGVENHVKSISERLVDRNHEVVVHTADRGRDVPRQERLNGVQIRRHRSFAPGGAFHVAPAVATSIRRTDADIVHAHNYHSLPALFTAIGVDHSRFVITPHYHGRSESTLRDHLLSAYRPIGSWMLDSADEVLAVSNWEHKQLAKDFGIDSTLVPNGIDVDRFKKAVPVERAEEYLLCVGRLMQYKGVQHAIVALKEMPNYNLLIAGTGPHQSVLERLAERYDVTDRVEFLGFVPDEDLPGLYAGASAYLSLSEFEAFGMTVGEALASGTPCVVRDAGALSDWSEDAGVIVVDESSPAAVARAVEQTVDCEPQATEVISWDEVVNEVVRIYRHA